MEPYVLEARRCISYLTMESRKDIPKEFGNQLGNRIFGCDACQEVCPYNQRRIETKVAEFKPRVEWTHLELDEILAMDQAGKDQRFKGSSMERVKLEYLQHVASWCRENVG